ncbi:MAG: ATP-binding cassette domain-containing protein [Actinomycetota bacterium]|nr:ATP-binding cassette domain-containing protein [Actinomycetota bacterium]
MSHVDVQHVSYSLPDGRVLLNDITFRIPDGAIAALVGPNGAGKTTLLRMVAGDIAPDTGAIVHSGQLAVMRQFIGQIHDGTVRDLLLRVSPPELRKAAAALDAAELRMMEIDDESSQMAYASAIADFGDAGGYDAEVTWDVVSMAAMGETFETVRNRRVNTLSGGEQKRIVLEYLFRGVEEVLLLDEPDNYLDVLGKIWLEQQLKATTKTVLLISHDRELLKQAATHIVSVELGAAGNSIWVHGGNFDSYHVARRERFSRLEELRRRWDEELIKLRALVLALREKAKFNDGLASRYQAAVTRLKKFEEVGPPMEVPREQNVNMRLHGGRTAKRAVVAKRLELTGLTAPFDLEIWFGERLAILGANGSGKSHLLRLLARGGSDPEIEHQPVGEADILAVAHSGSVRLGSRVRPGWFAQTHLRPDLTGRTLLEVLHRGDGRRVGLPREMAARALDRYELALAGEQIFDTLSGGQQARFQVLLLELSGATLLLLDEPTDNLDLASAEALEIGLNAFEGTVVAVTHDRWFARNFDRFLIFGRDGSVTLADEPVWCDW